jgi:hypothetical protein
MRTKTRQRVGNLSARNVGKSPRDLPVSGGAFEADFSISSPKHKLLEQILALRDSIEAESGILSESYPLIRGAREK